MIIDFENLNPGAWFDYDKDEDGNVVSRVKIRAHSSEFFAKVRDECVKERVEFKSARKHGQLQPVTITETDETKMRHMLWDEAIEDWAGFEDPNGAEIVCNEVNKIILMNGSPKFFKFVDECIDILDKQMTRDQEEIEKN